MNKKLIIGLGIFFAFFAVASVILNNAKNEYLKDQIFIEIQKNVQAKTGNKAKTEIEDIVCEGVFLTTCTLTNLDFYVMTTKKEKLSFVNVDEIKGQSNFINIIFNKIDNQFSIKNFHFNEEFLKKREFNPLVPYDDQEMISVLRKYGSIDIDFFVTQNNIDEEMKVDIKLFNELFNFKLKTDVIKLNPENSEDKTNDVLLSNLEFKIEKKEFDSKFFNVLKEREPKYFEKFSEDFIFKAVQQKYKEFFEDKFAVNLDPMRDFFFNENKVIIIKSKKDNTVSTQKQLTPFFVDMNFGMDEKRDLNKELDKMNLELSVIDYKNN